MIICNNCGVELDESFSKCPLCGNDPSKKSADEIGTDLYPHEITTLQRKVIRKQTLEMSSVITFSIVVVCTVIAVVIKSGLKWSLYADVSVLSSWVILTLFLFFHRKILILIPGLLSTLLLMLYMLSLISPGVTWFMPVGLPLSVFFFAGLSIIILLLKSAGLKGFNIIALSLIITSGFCISIEIFIDRYVYAQIDLRWSLIVAVSLLPAILIFFFLHYRLKKGNRLDSFFHV